MNQTSKRILSVMLTLLMALSLLVGALPTEVAATGTGYTASGDVQYVAYGKYTANWGVRGETCSFLSPYANGFYTDEYSFDTLSQLSGGTDQSSAHSSALYSALQALMTDNHKSQTSYGETRYQYMYTDCQRSDPGTILSFYSGKAFVSKWDSGSTWNREHIWPASKSLSGRPSNGDRGEGADIMMLRPTLKSENGSRSNKAFGVSSGYFVPNEDVRGDCARIALYVYVRWGNYANMWGSSGVMENLDVLLQWMEEDPVDTWEMGRNDAVQSITGTRNVFVDYPEYAWLLFGQSAPADLVSPSDNGSDGTSATPSDYYNDLTYTYPSETTPTETEPSTAPSTEAPTAPSTEAPTAPSTQPEPTPTVTQPSTEATQPTQTVPPATEAPTAPTDATEPTESTVPTEAPTEVAPPTEATQPSTPVPAETTQPGTSAPTETAPGSNTDPTPASPVILILCIIVAIAAIGGICCYFLIFRKKKTN